MADKKEEIPKPVEKKEEKIELLQTVKESGLGLRMPDGQVLDLSNLDPSLAYWMSWVTETLNKILRNVG